MPGVGKLLKQAAKMQKQMQALQEELATKTVTVSAGGGAVSVTVSLQQEVKALTIDPEFLREEEAELVQETLLEALRDALKQSKEQSEAAQQELTSGLQMPGMPGLM